MARNPITYRACFSKLRMHAFGKEQILEYSTDVELYQARDSPELWMARPSIQTGMHRWEASHWWDLAGVIERDFVLKLSEWTPSVSSGLRPQRAEVTNVVQINRRRRA